MGQLPFHALSAHELLVRGPDVISVWVSSSKHQFRQLTQKRPGHSTSELMLCHHPLKPTQKRPELLELTQKRPEILE
eukprot:7720095-Prorocentrum_lima.AAC.1